MVFVEDWEKRSEDLGLETVHFCSLFIVTTVRACLINYNVKRHLFKATYRCLCGRSPVLFMTLMRYLIVNTKGIY